MSPDPAGRYPTADALAADVRRWAADEPVDAYPEPWPARLGRWTRRHRAAVTAAAAVLVTGVVGLAASTALVWREERRTAEQRDHARREWARAEENLGLAQGLALNLVDISERHLPNVRQSETARKELTAAAVDGFRRLAAQRPDDPEVRLRTAMAYRHAANVRSKLNDTAAAEPLHREAVNILQRLATDRPTDRTAADRLAEALRDQAQLFGRLGRLGDAAAAGRRAAGLAEELVAADPGQPDYRRTLATGLIDLSGYEHARGRHDASAAAAGRAADLLRRLADGTATPRRDADRLYRAMALHRHAIALRDLGRRDDSLAASGDALAVLDRLPAEDPNAQHFRGRVLVEQAKALLTSPGRWADADRDASEAIRLWDGLKKRSPLFARYREWQAAGYEVRGRVRTELKQWDEAAADLETARTMLEKLAAEAPDQPGYRGLLGRTYLSLARLEAARGAAGRVRDWLLKARDAFREALERSPESAADLAGRDEAAARLNAGDGS
jgi:hypothetical protein